MNTELNITSNPSATIYGLRPADFAIRLGYCAWIVYGLLVAAGGWLLGGIGGVALMTAVIAIEYRSDAVKLMDCTSLSYFAVEIMIVFAGGVNFIERFHLIIVWGVFAAVGWLTILADAPFTLEYTREAMPATVWDEPGFLRMNRLLTVVWSLIFTLGMVLGAAAIGYGHTLLLGMVIPAAAMGVGLLLSNSYPRRYAERLKQLAEVRTANLDAQAAGQEITCRITQ